MFEGRSLLIVTKHKKEGVLAPLFERAWGVSVFTVPDIDTDQLGTFSGEVEREDDPLTTLRKKCDWGVRVSGCDLVVASEGSFGPHPALFFVPAGDEMIMLQDRHNGLEIVARDLSTETNFDGCKIDSEPALLAFAEKVGFPEHAVILRPDKNRPDNIIKGIQQNEELLLHYRRLRNEHASVYVETDMRALYNPTRMKNIARVGQKLIEKVGVCCPQCNTPGFSVVEVTPGLPCLLCGQPTRSTLYQTLRCQRCTTEKIEHFPRGKKNEDPQFCDHCNP